MPETIPHKNINGLDSTSIGHVVHYGKNTYVIDAVEGNSVLSLIRTLLREGKSDIVPLAHRDGLVWLTVGPGVQISIDEVEPKAGQSEKAARKSLGLV